MTLTIRTANAADQAALDRLAQLDSRTLPAAPHLLAVADGQLVAAVSTRDGDAIADPFAHTADAVALLRRRARHLRSQPAPRRRLALSGLRAVSR